MMLQFFRGGGQKLNILWILKDEGKFEVTLHDL